MPLLRPAKPFVAGIGLCASAGANSCENFENLKIGKNFFRPQNIFNSPKFGQKLCGQAENYSPKYANKKLSKCAKILFSAIDEALTQANLPHTQKASCGIFLGTSIGGVFETEEALHKNMSGEEKSFAALRYYECSSLADMAAKRFGLGKIRMTFSTACSSSGLAMEAAVHALSEGKIKAALVCGVDALSRITVNGFGSLLLLSNSHCKPFDKNRDGINLGEGAGAIVLVEETPKPLAQISACACTCDAHHPTAPHPEGAGLLKALNNALETARLDKRDISFVCAHGTGTAGNDISEFKALKNFWSCDIPPYFSIKGVFGHTLGASGAVNAVMSIKALSDSLLIPNAGLEELDPEIDSAPNSQLKKLEARHIVTNSLGFGGNNSTLVISTPQDAFAGEKNSAPLYIYSTGVVSPLGNSEEEFLANFGKVKSFECDTSAILKDMPPLKKRRLARMQQMALEAANQSLADMRIDPEKTCACFATGLGMTEQTSRFIEGVLVSSEAEASPTAFTNSVHNAPPSAIANAHKFTGLNSAVTAKEISFESALWQVWTQLKYAAAECAIIAAADEKSPYIDSFRSKHAFYSQSDLPTSEGALAYFVRADNTDEKAKAAIRFVEFAERPRDTNQHADWVLQTLSDHKISPAEISSVFIPSQVNGFEKSVFEKTFEKIGIKRRINMGEELGLSYINSAYFPLLAMREGKGKHLMFTISSAGAMALTLLETL